MIKTPALPAYIPFRLEAAPMNSPGTLVVLVAVAEVTTEDAVPTGAVVYAIVVLLYDNVEVTDATTSDTVIVCVLVAVEKRVVVSSANARRGRSAKVRVEKRILTIDM